MKRVSESRNLLLLDISIMIPASASTMRASAKRRGFKDERILLLDGSIPKKPMAKFITPYVARVINSHAKNTLEYRKPSLLNSVATINSQRIAQPG